MAVRCSVVAAALGFTVFVAPGWSEEGVAVPAQVTEWLREANEVARAGGGPGLVLDETDVPALASALVRLHDRHARGALGADVLKAEVQRWGAVLGELRRRSYPGGKWGRARKRNLGYGFSVYVGATESDDFDLVERFVTEDLGPPATEVRLRLSLLPPQVGVTTPQNKGMKLTKLSAAPTLTPQAALGRRCRLMPAPARMDAGTASQLIPGVRRTWQRVGMVARAGVDRDGSC